MRISIVTISYNQSEYLSECIESVLSQKDILDIEYIIVDPGSTDGSRELISSLSKSIDKIIFEPDKGPADGLNKGFSHATGDIYGYINADDFFLPNSLEIVRDAFSEDGRADVIYGDGYRLYDNGWKRKIYSCPWSFRGYIYGGFPVLQQSTFFRSKAFHAVHGFNCSNSTCWDGELLVDMAINGAHIRNLNKEIGVFRIHNESISGSGRLNAQYQTDKARIESKAFPREHSVFLHALFRYYYKIYLYVYRPEIFFVNAKNILISLKET